MTSPTANTLKLLRKEGWTAQVTEHWNQFAKVRQDLFGFVDVLAMRDGEFLAVQATSASNHAARRTKVLASPHFAKLVACRCRVEVWSWKQKRKGARWEVWRERLTLKGGRDDC